MNTIDLILLLVTTGRWSGTAAGIIGIISVLVARTASKMVPESKQDATSTARLAMGVAVVGLVFGIVHLMNTSGPFGTGQGRAGAIVGMVISVCGAVYSMSALRRLR